MPAKSTTLTQRRSGSSNSGPDVDSDNMTQLRSVGDMQAPENGSVFKIILWGIVILGLGIGLALLVRKLTSDDKAETTPEPEQTEETTLDTTEDTTTDETDTDEEALEEDTTTEETAEEDTTTDTPTIPTTPGLTNEYSTSAQSINDSLTTNSITIAGYSYATYADRFEYNVKLAATESYPTVSATLDSTEMTLTVVVSNVTRDNIVGNGGEGSTAFTAGTNTSSADISNASNKSTFEFNLSKATQYKINAIEENGVKMIRIEIKNN